MVRSPPNDAHHSRPRSNPRGLRYRSLALHVPSVQRAGRFEQDDLHFFVGNRSVLDTTRNDQKIAGLEIDRAIPKLHAKTPAMHEEHLVFVIVMMPHELTHELHDLYVLAIQFANDLW